MTSHYVYIYNPARTSKQACVPTGRVLDRYAEFLPISQGYYRERFWAPKEQIAIPTN